jgi:putative transposase
MLWAWLARAWCGWRSTVYIVKPETVVVWHRRGFRLFWTWKSRHRAGRPAVPHDVRALIRDMSTANPLWGAPRIHGELLKLGISVSQIDRRHVHATASTPCAYRELRTCCVD